MSIPSDQNTSTKVNEKISKYKDLEIEITKIRRVKTEIVPVIIGELALISNGMERNLGFNFVPERIMPGLIGVFERSYSAVSEHTNKTGHYPLWDS